MELEEAIKKVKKDLESTKRANECGLATRGEFNKEIEAIETVLEELREYREGEIISLKVLENYYLVSKDKEKQMTLANEKLFEEYVPKKIADKQEKIIELMSRFIDTELSSEHLSKVLKIDVKPLETYREDIKQYFEKKAEE